VPALDALVGRLVGSGVAVRELSPVVSPLEAAFLALTEAGPLTEVGQAQHDGEGR
jgi:ABC-2 type transport system ATP-binding protein